VPAENYHATVIFMGSVDPDVAAQVAGRLRQVASKLSPFTLAFERVGAYPNLRRPAVVWAGPSHRNERFEHLCAAAREALAPLGVVNDTRGDAHVTLCRCARESRRVPRIELAHCTTRVERLSLFESFLGAAGARYVVLEDFPFGPASESGSSGD
jgi:RNA 2',3'-cyclic 3'-phosphodiesterase